MAFSISPRVFGRPEYFRHPNTSSNAATGNGFKGRNSTPSGSSSTRNSVPDCQFLASLTDLGRITCPFDESLVVAMINLPHWFSKITVRHVTRRNGRLQEGSSCVIVGPLDKHRLQEYTRIVWLVRGRGCRGGSSRPCNRQGSAPGPFSSFSVTGMGRLFLTVEWITARWLTASPAVGCLPDGAWRGRRVCPADWGRGETPVTADREQVDTAHERRICERKAKIAR
jgi:hypothetical protein